MTGSPAPGIAIRGLSKDYGGGVLALSDVDLSIAAGEFMVLVGPSGCGKSTLLRVIAGLEPATAGTVEIAGVDVTAVPPAKRDIAMVFQNYALYPHMSVYDNLAFGLRLRKTAKSELRERVNDVAAILGLTEMLDRRPGKLSGGQRQRVAIGRAMVRQPQAFLMDEPLSNLDAKLRVSMRAELARLHDRLGIATVYVTHDQVEAMTLGHRVAVMRDGEIQQCGTPAELFGRPRNVFVAGFIGSPSMNLIDAVVDDGRVRFAEHSLPAAAGRLPAGFRGPVVLGLRPTVFEHGRTAPSDAPRIGVDVEVVENLGSESLVVFSIDAAKARAGAAGPLTDDAGDDGILFAGDRRTRLVARVDERTAVAQGERIELAVDPGRLHYFDPETGLALADG